jgi:hypothetical protein
MASLPPVSTMWQKSHTRCGLSIWNLRMGHCRVESFLHRMRPQWRLRPAAQGQQQSARPAERTEARGEKGSRAPVMLAGAR